MKLFNEILSIDLEYDIPYTYNDEYGEIIKENSIYISNNTISLLKELFYSDSDTINISSNEIDLNTCINAKNFISKYFILHNINYLKDGYNLIRSSPFDIPVDIDYSGCGKVIWERYIYEDKSEEVIFHNILLPKVSSELIPIIYSHEIIHTQVYTSLSSNKELHNDELLSIFIEYLYLLEQNSHELNKIHNYYRLKELLSYAETIKYHYDNNLDIDYKVITAYKFFVSIITSYKLFNIYLTSNISIRKEIINNIQNIFDGNKSIDDLLDNYSLKPKKRTIKK